MFINFGGGEKRPDKEVFFNHEIGRKRQRSQTTDDDAWDDDWDMPYEEDYDDSAFFDPASEVPNSNVASNGACMACIYILVFLAH